jgi:hypothetical protein
MSLKNVNRGFKKLRVWQDAISFYVLACKNLANFPFELRKVASNAIDAAHSISRNIAEGYCRRRLREYLNYLILHLDHVVSFILPMKVLNKPGRSLRRNTENWTKLTIRWKMNCLAWFDRSNRSRKTVNGKTNFYL